MRIFSLFTKSTKSDSKIVLLFASMNQVDKRDSLQRELDDCIVYQRSHFANGITKQALLQRAVWKLFPHLKLCTDAKINIKLLITPAKEKLPDAWTEFVDFYDPALRIVDDGLPILLNEYGRRFLSQ